MKKANLIANYGGAAFVAASQVVLIPFYMSGLGERQWGLLSALVAISSTLLVIEAGVSLAVARGFSSDEPGSGGKLALFQHVERRYFAVAAAIGLSIGILGAPISHLLARDAGPDASRLIVATGVMAALQITGSLYRSVLIGLGRQVRLNVLLVAFTILRHGLGLAAAFWLGNVLAVAIAFATGFGLESFCRRIAARRALTREVPFEAPARPVASIFRGVPALSLAGALGAFCTQVDRLFLNLHVDAVALGHYAVAATVSLAVLQLVYPLSSALLPTLQNFTADNRAKTMRRTFAFLLGLLALVWLGAAMLALGGLAWWLSSERIAGLVAPLFLAHLVGTSVNVLCVPLHMTLLAHRQDRGILLSNGLALALQTAALFVAVPRLGALAGSVAWIVANAALFVGYLCLAALARNDDRRRLA